METHFILRWWKLLPSQIAFVTSRALIFYFIFYYLLLPRGRLGLLKSANISTLFIAFTLWEHNVSWSGWPQTFSKAYVIKMSWCLSVCLWKEGITLKIGVGPHRSPFHQPPAFKGTDAGAVESVGRSTNARRPVCPRCFWEEENGEGINRLLFAIKWMTLDILKFQNTYGWGEDCLHVALTLSVISSKVNIFLKEINPRHRSLSRFLQMSVKQSEEINQSTGMLVAYVMKSC